MSNAIPKEMQTAYQRWELASFGDDQPRSKDEPEAAPQLTAGEIETLKEEARRAGHAAGHEEGLTAGLSEGVAAGLAEGRAQAAVELVHLREIAKSFGTEVAQANEVIADDMLNLALDLAKAMLKVALTVKPELVLPVVGETIRYLPSLQQPAVLHLNPLDALLVKDHMADELAKSGWRVAEDMQMQRGGCRVETASNQIDATISSRWQRIAEALGKQSDWLQA